MTEMKEFGNYRCHVYLYIHSVSSINVFGLGLRFVNATLTVRC